MNHLISVIIPTHNRADLLPRAIGSVLSQSYKNLECIVVDDASADNGEAVVDQLDDDRLVYLRHETNRGASAARNTGIAQAKGEMIAFLDDDDEWLPSKLEKQVSLLKVAPPQVGMVYCWMDYYDHGRLIKEHHPTYRGYVFPHVLDRQRIGGCPTLLVRRSVLDDVGGFDESLPRGNDGDFIRRVCRKYHVDLVPEVLVNVYVGHTDRITSTSESGLLNRIKGGKNKLEKFASELDHYPQAHANILGQLAVTYQKLGEYGKAWTNFRKALQIAPRPYLLYRDGLLVLLWGIKKMLGLD
jgi:glycosyltransferase involved in cell wall biosynthesis